MVHALALIVLGVSALDHWTTYLCLRASVGGWQVTEANPVAAWLFERVGLVDGLLLDSVITVAAIAFLTSTPLVPRPAKLLFLAAVSIWTGAAVANNFGALQALGLSPLG
jgi:hypothetical protein